MYVSVSMHVCMRAHLDTMLQFDMDTQLTVYPLKAEQALSYPLNADHQAEKQQVTVISVPMKINPFAFFLVDFCTLLV